MKEDKKLVKHARQNFRSNLKSARIHYRKEVRTLRQTVPKKGRFRKPAQNSLFQDKKIELKENLLSSQKEAEEKFLKEITYVSPRLLKAKEIKNYRLPQAQERLRTARKHLSEVKLSEKQKAANPKFTFQKENPSPKSRFQFHQEKSFDRLSAEKDVSSAKREVKQLKKVQKTKKNSTKVKVGLGLAASESLDLVAQDDDLDGLRTLKDTSLKARRYGRFTYQAGKVVVKSGQTGVRFTKTKFSHGKERFQNFKKGKGFTRQKPLKPRRRYQTFLKHARKHSLAGVKGVVQAIKGSMTFFSVLAGNPLTWIVSGILLILLLMMSFFMSVSGSSIIQQDEIELSKSYTHMTLEDAEHTRTNEKGITFYTKIDEVMVYMNHQYQDYKLDDFMESRWYDLQSVSQSSVDRLKWWRFY
jgi:hypothetical protein